MLTGSRGRATVTVLALALAASGCGARHASQASPAPSPSSGVKAESTLSMGDAIVTTDRLDELASEVARSALSAANRGAFARFVKNNRKRPEAYDGKTVRQIVNFEVAYENGLAAVEATERREEANARHLETMIDARVASGRDLGRAIAFGVSLRNKTDKRVKHVDVELEITDALVHKQLGLIELNIDRDLGPHASATFAFPVRYGVFGIDAAKMMAASHRAKTFAVRPTQVIYADGSAVGIPSD